MKQKLFLWYLYIEYIWAIDNFSQVCVKKSDFGGKFTRLFGD